MTKRPLRRARDEDSAETAAPQRRKKPTDPALRKLQPGDRVTAHLPGRTASSGIVETMTDAKDIIWVRFDGPVGRQMIHGDEGSPITIHPNDKTL